MNSFETFLGRLVLFEYSKKSRYKNFEGFSFFSRLQLAAYLFTSYS